MNDFDVIPVRLPSGTKAIIQLPRPFTLEDGIHLMDFISLYIEEKQGKDTAGRSLSDSRTENMSSTAPKIWIKHLTGAECKPDGRCYEIAFTPMPGYTEYSAVGSDSAPAAGNAAQPREES